MSEPLILVIDDSRDERIIARTLLRRFGYRVVTSRTATRGVRLAQRLAPDLIVLDLMMPGTDGIGALAALRSDPATSATPVILYTAYADIFWRQIAALEDVRVLEKPIGGTHFVDAIRAVLESHQPSTAAA